MPSNNNNKKRFQPNRQRSGITLLMTKAPAPTLKSTQPMAKPRAAIEAVMQLHGLTSPDLVLSVEEKSDPRTSTMKERIDHICTGLLYEKLSQVMDDPSSLVEGFRNGRMEPAAGPEIPIKKLEGMTGLFGKALPGRTKVVNGNTVDLTEAEYRGEVIDVIPEDAVTALFKDPLAQSTKRPPSR